MTHTKNELETHIDSLLNKLLALVPASERDTAYELLADLDRATREHKLLCITDDYNSGLDEWEIVEPEYFRDPYGEPYQIPVQTDEAESRAFFLVTFLFRPRGKQSIQVPGAHVSFSPSSDDVCTAINLDAALTGAALVVQLPLLQDTIHPNGVIQRVAVGKRKAVLSCLETMLRAPLFTKHDVQMHVTQILEPERTGFGWYLNLYERLAGAHPLDFYEGPFADGFRLAFGESPPDYPYSDPATFVGAYLLGALLCFLCYPPENWDAG